MKVQHLVVDSGALIKNADIKDLGENIYTCPDVVLEIKDRETRRKLAVLPYELNLKVPSQDAVRKIMEVSKATGDYRSLSTTDINVLALTYELILLHGNSSLLTDVTEKTDSIQIGGSIIGDLKLPGFYLPSRKDDVACNKSLGEGSKDADSELVESLKEISFDKEEKPASNEDCIESMSADNVALEESSHEVEDNDGWITPSNLKKVYQFNTETSENEDNSAVACITTDFAMQNVLKKMNIRILSVDGILIKSIRSKVLRCHACFEITKVMTKVFCPKCGNRTLKRVPVELNPDGTMKLFFSRNPKVLNPRGLQYSIPMPKGGKHANNPILVEDQRVPHNRPSKKALQKTNVWGDSYDTSVSPFAINDTESKAFRLGIRPNNYRSNRRGNKR